MILRRAVVADIDRAMPMLRRVLSAQPHGMVIDENKLRVTALRTITHGYCAVAEYDGKIVAYIAGLVDENPYFERLQLTVIGWYSEAPGAGFRLYRMMMKWRDANPMIGSVCLLANPDEKLNRIMVRHGAIPMPSYWIP